MGDKECGKLLDNNKKIGKWCYPNHRIKKRSAPRLPKRDNDIYVTKRTNFQCQLKKCQKLFEDGHSEIVIHGLGAVIATAVNLSLTLQDKLSHTVDVAVNTSSVELLDDFMPLSDEEEPFCRKRLNSAIHIKVYRKANF